MDEKIAIYSSHINRSDSSQINIKIEETTIISENLNHAPFPLINENKNNKDSSLFEVNRVESSHTIFETNIEESQIDKEQMSMSISSTLENEIELTLDNDYKRNFIGSSIIDVNYNNDKSLPSEEYKGNIRITSTNIATIEDSIGSLISNENINIKMSMAIQQNIDYTFSKEEKHMKISSEFAMNSYFNSDESIIIKSSPNEFDRDSPYQKKIYNNIVSSLIDGNEESLIYSNSGMNTIYISIRIPKETHNKKSELSIFKTRIEDTHIDHYQKSSLISTSNDYIYKDVSTLLENANKWLKNSSQNEILVSNELYHSLVSKYNKNDNLSTSDAKKSIIKDSKTTIFKEPIIDTVDSLNIEKNSELNTKNLSVTKLSSLSYSVHSTYKETFIEDKISPLNLYTTIEKFLTTTNSMDETIQIKTIDSSIDLIESSKIVLNAPENLERSSIENSEINQKESKELNETFEEIIVITRTQRNDAESSVVNQLSKSKAAFAGMVAGIVIGAIVVIVIVILLLYLLLLRKKESNLFVDSVFEMEETFNDSTFVSSNIKTDSLFTNDSKGFAMQDEDLAYEYSYEEILIPYINDNDYI